tara:strand:+ start:113 stop:964 length:852 start_codon:yes stop_codon:yes gene_type:complete
MAKKSRKKVKKVKSKSKVSSVSVKSSVYVDNKLNRRLGRVGKKYVKGKSNKYTVSKGVSVKSKVGKSKKAKKGVSKPKKSRPIEVGRLDELVNYIKENKLKKILIIGSQRSGTRMATLIISDECKVRAFYEEQYEFLLNYLDFYNKTEEFVVQSPKLTSLSHTIPSDLIIYITRDYDEIKKSADRIGWINEGNDVVERNRTKIEMDKVGLKPDEKKYSWIVKKEFWNKYQKKHIKSRYREIDYTDFYNHRLFLKKEYRDKANNGKGLHWQENTINGYPYPPKL